MKDRIAENRQQDAIALDEKSPCSSSVVNKAPFDLQQPQQKKQFIVLQSSKDRLEIVAESGLKCRSEGKEDGQKKLSHASASDGDNRNTKVVVGYALTSKKVKSFLKPKLEVLARYPSKPSVSFQRQKS